MSRQMVEHRAMSLSALLGYLFPAFAMIFGAWLGTALNGSESASAIGAIAGFLCALTIARIAIGLNSVSIQSNVSQQEFHHERHSNH